MDKEILNITLKKGIATEKVIPVKNIAEQAYIFLGDKDNPFLAPRGVCIHNGMLIVSDTGQNRVFIWHAIPSSSHQIPDVVLGQMDAATTGRNSGHEVNASTLQYPSGIWTDGHRLIIADAWNHRVLIWHSIPQQHGQEADVVIGQKNFESNLPNISGLGTAPSAQSLYWPYGVSSDGQTLYIADTGNRRVLVYNSIPTENFTAADAVIGKASMDERDYDHQDAIWPYSIKTNTRGAVAITDTQYYRVLLWNDVNSAKAGKAEVLIGQTSIEENGQNQFHLFPKENTLSWCYDTCYYKDGIFVADTGNSRILWYETIPVVNGESATGLIGKDDFNTGSENLDTIYGTDRTLYWPFSISVLEQQHLLAVADTGNHRIIFYHLKC